METHECYLMHKDTPVLSFTMNDDGMCCNVIDLYNRLHLPPGMQVSFDVNCVNRFLMERQFSSERKDVERLKVLNLFDPSMFFPFHFVSAFDCYWVRYEREGKMFSDVSFFGKTFSEEDMGLDTDVLTYANFDHTEDINVDRDSPNMTISSDEPRFIFPMEDGLHLLFETPVKDISMFLKKAYGKYMAAADGAYSYFDDSLFYDVILDSGESRELIPLSGYFQDEKDRPENAGMSDAELFITLMDRLSVPGGKEYMTALFALDDKFGIDRELTDVYVIRNPDTLTIESFAPVYNFPLQRQR